MSHPGEIAQLKLRTGWAHHHFPGGFRVGCVVHEEGYLTARTILQQPIRIVARKQRLVIDRQQEVAHRDVDSGLGQGRAGLLVPVLTGEDLGYAVASLVLLEFAAENADRNP